MHIETIFGTNIRSKFQLLEQNFRHRHKIFVDRLGWEDLRKADQRDVDQFDNADAQHLLLVDGERVLGGARLTPLTNPTLLLSTFTHLIQMPLPGRLEDGLDWTRHYIRFARRNGKRLAPEAAILYSGAMEHALLTGKRYFTFVSSIYMIELLTSFNWKVSPLGAPQMIEGSPTIAGWIEVSEEALFHMNAYNGITKSHLNPKTYAIEEEMNCPQYASA